MEPAITIDSVNIFCGKCGTNNRVNLEMAAEKNANCAKCGEELIRPDQVVVEKPREATQEKIGFLLSFGLVSGLLALLRLGLEYVSDPLYRKAAFFLLIGVVVFSKQFRIILFKAAFVFFMVCAIVFSWKNWEAIANRDVSVKVAATQIFRIATGYGPIRDFHNQIKVDRYRSYVNAVDTRNPDINTLASLITKDCPPDQGCQAQKIAQFVSTTINYRSDPLGGPDYIKSPVQTLKARAGDCEDMTILASSLLGSLGIRTQMVFINKHVYPRACFKKAVAHRYLDSGRAHSNNGEVCYDLEPTDFGSGLGYKHSLDEKILMIIDSTTKQPILPMK